MENQTMSERIKTLIEATDSTDTEGDETSHGSESSECSDDASSDMGSSCTSSKSYTECSHIEDDVSLVDSCTSNPEDDEESDSGSSDDESTNTDNSPRSPDGHSNASIIEEDNNISSTPPEESFLTMPELYSRNVNESNVTASRHRVPGGAAAKIMLVGPKGSGDIADKSDDENNAISSSESGKVNESSASKHIEQEMQQAKDEFHRSKSHRRSHQELVHELQRQQRQDDLSETCSSVSVAPSFLNRNEIFHKTAEAAVAALLTPRSSVAGINNSDVISVCSSLGTAGLPSSKLSIYQAETGKKGIPSIEQHQQHSDPPVTQNLLTPKAEQVLKEMEKDMLDPSPTLTDLLTAIASPESYDKDYLHNDLGFMVRRKNACGALQVMTTDQRNRVKICWTAGVLPALTSVLTDSMSHASLDEAYPDRRIRTEYEIARSRAIAALMNLSMPPRNRITVFHTPELMQAVLFIIENDKDGAARRSCCALLALLAKSADNRKLMFHMPGLIDLARKLIEPRPARVEVVKEKRKKQLYPWSEKDEDDNSDSDDTSNSSHSDEEVRERRRKSVSYNTSSDKSASEDTSTHDGESGTTPKVKGSQTPLELSGYDDTVDEELRGARVNMFAMLVHLVKEKDIAYQLGREMEFLETIVTVSKFKESTCHEFAITVMAHLTRHRSNKQLAFKPKSFVPALVEATLSLSDVARLYAIYAMQNLSQEKSCRQELAIANNLIVALCDRCRNSESDDERLAAISTLKNLCDEPANLIPVTNTPGCVSTLMHYAHGGVNEGTVKPVTEMMQYRACDALATLSHWLRKISTSGYALEAAHSRGSGRSVLAKGQLFVPSLRTINNYFFSSD